MREQREFFKMHPTLLKIASLEFHAYPAMLAIAFLTCTLLAVRNLHRRNPPVDITPNVGLWVFIGALLGAKAYWILQFSEPRYLWRAVFVWQGGLVFYGGLIGGLVALLAYVKLNKLPLLIVVDSAAPALALGEAITRIGCFLNGCCWGAPSSAPWAVCFPRHSHPFAQQVSDGLLTASAMQSLPVHPTQLYMTIGLVIGAAILWFLLRKGVPEGCVVAGYLVIYGILRFCVELFRADSARSVGGMTVSQSVSAGLLILGLALGAAAIVRKRYAFMGGSEKINGKNVDD
jgi:phosphatidylglycerol:prolipoprotein diacylglycerol transferase